MASKKYYSIFYIFFILTLFLSSCSSTKYLTVKNDDFLKKVKEKYAPDSRVAVFDVTATKKGKTVTLFGETNIPEAKAEVLENTRSCIIVDSIRVLPAQNLGNKTKGLVKLSVCNIRSKPKHSSELLSQAILGTPINILKKENSWFYIQTPDGYLGWVDNGGILPMSNYEIEDWTNSQKVIFTDIFGLVYSSPNIEAKIVSDIVEGSILKLMGESLNKEFWIVSYPNKRVGYIQKVSAEKFDLFLNKRANYNSSDIIETAENLLGFPYLWGGTSSKALDCSGFTKTVFFMNGILLPRDASQQVHVGKNIPFDKSLSNIIKGDLLFFGNLRKDGSQRITHVAIYMGNGKIIHSTGEVKIQSLKKGDADFTEYRLNSLLKVKRIIGNEGKYGIIKLINVKSYSER